MPKIVYRERRFRAATLAIIERAEQVCEEYQTQGYDITLRQLYYQFVSRGWMENRQSEYKRLGGIVGDARLAGLIDWNHIEDRTRNIQVPSAWDDPASIVQAVSRSYAIDKWADQDSRVEVWVEKDALVGILEAVCDPENVPYFSCRGYTSLTEIWGAAQRLRRHLSAGQNVTVIHLGDHDPSGLDMTRDIEDRMRMFIHRDGLNDLVDVFERGRETGRWLDWKPGDPVPPEALEWMRDVRDGWGDFEIVRVALNIDQVEQYDPPPNFAKETDARWRRYNDETGLTDSWELDALDPAVLATLIRDEIHQWRDEVRWDAMVAREEEEREVLIACSDRWDEVRALLAS